jgi:hypothetical protein
MIDGGRHTPHLPVATFDQNHFNPRRGNGFAEADWRITRWKFRLFRQNSNFRRERAISLNDEAEAEAVECAIVRNALDLHPVDARVFELRIGQAVLEQAIVSEKEQAFTITIQPSHRINVLYRNVIFQSLACTGKLAEHVMRFVEEYVAQMSDYIVNRKKCWQTSLCQSAILFCAMANLLSRLSIFLVLFSLAAFAQQGSFTVGTATAAAGQKATGYI